MNFLAHLHLARHSDEAMLGGLLGDFVGSGELQRFEGDVRREIRLHHRVDGFTDRHPEVVALRGLFPEGRRRYAGIALDVYFDHLLARDWARHSPVDLDAFTARFYRVLLAALPTLPERLQRIAPLMAQHDWLGSYRDRDSIDLAIRRIATRLSRNGDKLVACLPLLREHEATIAAAFDRFFPELEAYAAETRPTL